MFLTYKNCVAEVIVRQNSDKVILIKNDNNMGLNYPLISVLKWFILGGVYKIMHKNKSNR